MLRVEDLLVRSVGQQPEDDALPSFLRRPTEDADLPAARRLPSAVVPALLCALAGLAMLVAPGATNQRAPAAATASATAVVSTTGEASRESAAEALETGALPSARPVVVNAGSAAGNGRGDVQHPIEERLAYAAKIGEPAGSEVTGAPLPQPETAATSGPANAEDLVAKPELAKRASKIAKPSAKKASPAVVAQSDEVEAPVEKKPRRRRTARVDGYSAVGAYDGDATASKTSSTASSSNGKDEPGPIGKFFAWLKSGFEKPKTNAVPDDSPVYGYAPND